MEKINIIIFLVSIGFFIIGVIFLKSKSLKSSIEAIGTYKDVEKYLTTNALINIIAAILICISNVIDIILKTPYELYLVLPIIVLSSLISIIFSKSNKL